MIVSMRFILLSVQLVFCLTGDSLGGPNTYFWKPTDQNALAEHLIAHLWGPRPDETFENPRASDPPRPLRESNVRIKLEAIGKRLYGAYFAKHVYKSNDQLISSYFASYYGEDECDAIIAKIVVGTKAKDQ